VTVATTGATSDTIAPMVRKIPGVALVVIAAGASTMRHAEATSARSACRGHGALHQRVRARPDPAPRAAQRDEAAADPRGDHGRPSRPARSGLLPARMVLAAASGVACGVRSRAVRPAQRGRVLRGRATYYADRFAGRPTASGEPYDPSALTAAHRTLPFGTTVEVTNLQNQRRVVVRVNDRGPWGRRDRILDLSRRAAEDLDMIRSGVVPVEVQVLAVPDRD